METTSETTAPRVSDAAVRAKTGKDWAEWFVLLDAGGAADMGHRQIVALLAEQYELDGWWQQSVTVAYEQARGLRAKHQMPEGFQISVTKTIRAAARSLHEAWHDEATRRRWLAEAPISVRKETPGKFIRLDWDDGRSRVDVLFTPKGDAKTQVTVQHNKLADADESACMKAYWGEALARLKGVFEDQ
jgi:uncharacterized protein YndB with AHSA1/START domain